MRLSVTVDGTEYRCTSKNPWDHNGRSCPIHETETSPAYSTDLGRSRDADTVGIITKQRRAACGLPTGDVDDNEALDRIAKMLRHPDWGPGMLEDIAEVVAGTGRNVATQYTVSVDDDEGEPRFLHADGTTWVRDEADAGRFTETQLDAMALPDDAEPDAVETWGHH